MTSSLLLVKLIGTFLLISLVLVSVLPVTFFIFFSQYHASALAAALYQNPTYGYSIQYPDKWIKIDNSQDRYVFFSSDSSGTAIVGITAVNLDSSIPLDSYAKPLFDKIQSTPGAKIISSVRLTIAQAPAFGITYINPDGKETSEVFSKNGPIIYVLTYVSDYGNFPAYVQTFDKMIDTFEVTPVSTTQSPSSTTTDTPSSSSEDSSSSSATDCPEQGPGGCNGAFSQGPGAFSPINPSFGQMPLQQNIPQFNPNNP